MRTVQILVEKLKRIFEHYSETVKKSSFAKSVLTLSTGTIISQGVSLISTPIISRIYEQSSLGDFAVIISNSAIISMIASIGLMSAIMIPKEDDEARNICRLLIKAIFIIPFVILSCLILLSPEVQLFNVQMDYRFACLLMYVYIVTTNLASVCYSYINRAKLYSVLFWYPVIMTGINALVSIGLGVLGCGLWGYTLGNISASIVAMIYLLRHGNPFILNKAKRKSTIGLLKMYKDYTKYLLTSNVISTIGEQIPVQMISRFWGSVVTGSYTMCMSVLNIPSKLLSQPINHVFYKEATERYNTGKDIGVFSLKILVANVKVAIIPVVILIIFGPTIFSVVLGTKWEEAGVMASVLGIYQLINFSNSCLNGKYVIIKKQKIILVFNLIYMVITTTLFATCHMLQITFYTTLLVYSVIGSAFSIIDNYIFLKKVNVRTKVYVRFVIVYLFLPTAFAFLLNRLVYMVLT